MDTKVETPENQAQPTESSPSQEETSAIDAESPSTPTSLTGQSPPERLSEKRRREEEDDDELVKLTSVPKRRSSTSGGPGSAGRRKKSLTLGTVSATEKAAGTGVLSYKSAPPKRIAINLGSSTPKPSDNDSPDATSTQTSSEKENTNDNRESGKE